MISEMTHLTKPIKPAFSVCVYCGSRTGNTPEFAAMARQVGSWIGAHDGQLVFGLSLIHI